MCAARSLRTDHPHSHTRPPIPLQTTEGGQACVDYLRQHSIGRAKFIMLDKIAHIGDKAGAPFAAPHPACARLYDLITLREAPGSALAARLRTAFYFALRDTLVAPDMETAAAVAYAPGGRVVNRVVTRAGELIDSR